MNKGAEKAVYQAPNVEVLLCLEQGNLLREFSVEGDFEGIDLNEEVYD